MNGQRIENPSLADIREGDAVELCKGDTTIRSRVREEGRLIDLAGTVGNWWSLGWTLVALTRPARELPDAPGTVIVGATIDGETYDGALIRGLANEWHHHRDHWIFAGRIGGDWRIIWPEPQP